MKIGASLQMIYLGAIAPGGTLPADEALASCITIPVALAAGLEPDIAVTIAVPVSYTHLDVYKRQIENSIGYVSAVGWFKSYCYRDFTFCFIIY